MILRVKIMHRMAKVNRQRIANRCCIRIASSVIPLRASLSAPGVGYHCSYCAEDTRVLRFVARQLFLLGMVAPSRFRCMGRLAFWSYAGGTSSLARRSKKKWQGGPKKKEGPGSQAGRGGGISYLALAERSQPVRGPDNASVFVADCTCTRMLRFLRVFTVP